jgi:aryl-alcohol dehydrogenase-like predicted oxidoreductase
MGIGAMVWGDMSTAPWWSPARQAYGPTSTVQEQRAALEASLAAGVNFPDTAAMYGMGPYERRVGELTAGRQVVVATKFPAGLFSRADSLPAALEGSLARLRRSRIDLYQVHFPAPWMSIPALMDLMADAVEVGKVRAVGVSNYGAGADAGSPRRADRPGHRLGVQPGAVLTAAPPAGDRWRVGRLS